MSSAGTAASTRSLLMGGGFKNYFKVLSPKDAHYAVIAEENVTHGPINPANPVPYHPQMRLNARKAPPRRKLVRPVVASLVVESPTYQHDVDDDFAQTVADEELRSLNDWGVWSSLC